MIDTFPGASVIRLRPYTAGDVGRVLGAEAVASCAGAFEPAILDGPELPPGECWTAKDGETVKAVGGLAPMWTGRLVAWSMIGSLDRHEWTHLTWWVHAGVRDALRAGARRIEATTPWGWREGEHWLELLGFGLEGRMRAYDEQGRDHGLWARVA